MTCEHRFVPFPESLSKLYCQRCGDGRDAFGERKADARATRARSRPARAEPRLPLSVADPDAPAAEAILAEQRAVSDLEERLRDVVAAAGMPQEEADALVAEGLAFGPGLDLDHFTSIVTQSAQRQAPYSLGDAE